MKYPPSAPTRAKPDTAVVGGVVGTVVVGLVVTASTVPVSSERLGLDEEVSTVDTHAGGPAE